MATAVLKIVVLVCSCAFLATTAAIGLAFLRIPSSRFEENPWVSVSSLDAIPDDGSREAGQAKEEVQAENVGIVDRF